MRKEPLTNKGAQSLREELHNLKTVKRQQVIQAIAEARAHGDLKENAEYHAAREQQGFIEGRIAEIETRLANAHVVDVGSLNVGEKIVFGATVDLVNDDTGEAVRYQIVGDIEANITNGKVSIASPLARALIGKNVGDIAAVSAPGGTVEYEIAAVQYI